MKYVVVALSGASDQVQEDLGTKTPLEMSKVPNLDFFAKIGRLGSAALTSSKYGAYADVTLMNLLGYNADEKYTGRGPLEAANLELQLEEDEIPFRMNFVTEYNGKLADAEAGGISTKESKALINFLNKKVASDFVRFFPGDEYRHVVVVKDAHGYAGMTATTTCPHDILGQGIEQHWPKGQGAELMKKLMCDAQMLLQDHEINQVRLDLQENPANMVWVWGQGTRPRLDFFRDKYGVTASLISDAEYAKGLARLAGMTVVDSRHAHDDIADNYEQKGKDLIETLGERDFVCVHLKDMDVASRNGDVKEKVSAIEAADYFVLSRLRNYYENNPETKVLITTCHDLPWQQRKRAKSKAPFLFAGKNITADESDKFTELTCRASEWKFSKPTELIETFFKG